MEEAVAKMKAEFGDDAVILHTKKYKEGELLGLENKDIVEITVAIEDKKLEPSENKNSDSESESRQKLQKYVSMVTKMQYHSILKKKYPKNEESSKAEFAVEDKNSSVKIDDETNFNNDIRIIGIGGFGIRAVNYLYDKNFEGIDFLTIDTDKSDILNSRMPYLQIGKETTKGHGAGTNSKIGRKSAIEDYENISKLIKNSKTIIMILSSGGATGTGAAPMIAKFAKAYNCQTIAILTKAFILNHVGNTNRKNDEELLFVKNLKKCFDKIIEIEEDKALDSSQDIKILYTEIFEHVNEKIYNAIKLLLKR